MRAQKKLEFNSALACDGAVPAHSRLVPRSGTGPAISMRYTGGTAPARYSGIFPIDNNTAPGFYDLELTCTDGSRDTLRTCIHYSGYQGYVPTGRIINQVTGNTIRGAHLSIWRLLDGGGFNHYAGMIATDGTYSCNVPPGTYYIKVQYELGGVQDLPPCTVSGPALAETYSIGRSHTGPYSLIPYQDIVVTPGTADTTGPVHAELSRSASTVEGKWTDSEVGLAVVEVVPGTAANLSVEIAPFSFGAPVVQYSVALVDSGVTGQVTMRAVDRLGNQQEQQIALPSTTGAPPSNQPMSRFSLALPQPNPTRGALVLSFSLLPREPATIELVDISGRMVVSRRVKDSGVGTQQIRLSEPRVLGSGIYFVRLRQGRNTLVRKVCVLH